MAHISKYRNDKRATVLAEADLDYQMFGRQDPYHARIKQDAVLLNQNGYGNHVYHSSGRSETIWMNGGGPAVCVRGGQIITY